MGMGCWCLRPCGYLSVPYFWGIRSEIGEGNGTPLQYSCLENPMDGRAWKAAVHGVAEGQTRLSNFTFTFHFHALEKEMATHSSVLAWRIPGMGEPGGLPSLGSHRVGHDWSDLAEAAVRLFGKCLFLLFKVLKRVNKYLLFIIRKVQFILPYLSLFKDFTFNIYHLH